MLKWTTRGSLDDSDSAQAKFSGVQKSTVQAFSSVISQLTRMSNPDHASVDSDEMDDFQRQIKHTPLGSQERHESAAFKTATTSPPRRRAFVRGLKRSSSLSRGGRDPNESESFRHGSSRSLPSSPQTSHSTEDRQKKTGVLQKFKKLFRTAKSANKIYQTDSASGGKFSPGRARKRSRSPVKTQDTGNLKGQSSSKTRLTRLIETKREERKQTRSNARIPKFALPYKSESASSEEEHPYVQHGQLDKTLFLQKESSLRSDTREREGYELPAPNLRQKPHGYRQRAKADTTVFSSNAGFPELEASFQPQIGHVACLQRSSSLRLSINEHSLQYSKADMFDHRNTDFFTNSQRRRWSSQSTNLALRSSNYEKDCQPLPNVLPRSGSRVTSQLANKPSCSEESLFQFGESLVTMLETGSLRKVKVMPSQPDTIIQVKKSLSPVYRNPPLTFHEDVVITPRKATQNVKDKFQWSVTADGGMIITPTKESCRPDNMNHQQSDLVTHTGTPWPRNNNNGRAKMYGSKNIHHTEQETSDNFFKMCDVNEESALHDGPVYGCVAPSKDDGLEFAATRQDNKGVNCESSLRLHFDTEDKSEISRVRVKDIVKSIEEQCEGVRKRGFPEYSQTILVYGDTAGVGNETCRSVDAGDGSENTSEIPPGWIKDPGQEMDNKVNDTCSTSLTIKHTHNYSSCESEGFSPKICSSVSEARCSFPLTLQGTATGQTDRQMESPTESDICESPGDTRTCSSVSPQSSYTPSIPSDMINDTWTLPSDVQGIFSDSSDVDSLVRNIAFTNKTTKPTGKASAADDNSDKVSGQYKETEQGTGENKECNNIFRNQELTKREVEAPKTESYDVTKESLVSPSRRDDSSPVSVLLSANNLEEGITDVKAPLTMVPQDSSILEGTEDSKADIPEEQLSELSVHQQQNSTPAKIVFQASFTQSSMVESRSPRSLLLQQTSSTLGQREHAHPIISEVRQTESMHSAESDSENTGFLQTSDFEQEQGEQVSPSPLLDKTKLLQPQHAHEGETTLPALAVLEQEQSSLCCPTTSKGTSLNYESLLHNKTDSWEESGHETVNHATGKSGKKTSEVHDGGESLEQTNRTIGETKISKPTQAQSCKPTQLSEKMDSKHSKPLLSNPSTPLVLQCGNVEISTSTHIQSGKVGSLKPTDSPECPDAPVSSACVATEHGSRSGNDKPSLNVKPKKKVSFNLSVSQQDNGSSLSDVAVIEVVPRLKATPADQQNAKGVMDELDHSDNVSSTDVSSSFSLRSNDGQGVTQQVTSTSGDDLTWWGPDVGDDMDFFHDEINDKAVNGKTVNDMAGNGNTVNEKDDNDKVVNGQTVNDKDVKDTEDKHNTDTTKQTANLNLLTTHGDIDREDTSHSSTTSLSKNEVVNSEEAKRANALNDKRNEVHTWLKNEAAEFPISKDGHNISDRKSNGNKDTTSARKLDGNSDTDVPDKIQEHLLLTGMKSSKEQSTCQKGVAGSTDHGLTNGDESFQKIDFGNTNRDEKVQQTDHDITNRDGKVHKTDNGITNRDENVRKIDHGITNRDGHVHKIHFGITSADINVHLTDSDVKNMDGNVRFTDSCVTNDEINVHPTDSDTTHEDSNVHLADSDITNEERNVFNDSDFTEEDEEDSLSDTNSHTYDVSGTLARYKKVTAPWWEKPEVVDELSLESSASEDEESSILPEDLKRQQTARTASRLSKHLQRSPPKGCAIRADVKTYFRSKSPSKKSPKMYFKEISLQELSRKHGNDQTEQMADAASVHLHSSSESVKYPERNCMRMLSPRKQQTLLTGERKRFVFTKRSKRASGPGMVKANNDHTKTSCDGDQQGQFEFRSRTRVDNPVSVRSGRGGYSSESRGPYEVVNTTQTCDRRAGKKSLLNDASSPGNVPGRPGYVPGRPGNVPGRPGNVPVRSTLLVEDMSPSSPSLATKRKSVLAHANCWSGSGHCGKTSEGQTYEEFLPLQQTRILGKNSHQRLKVLNGPSKTNPSKCVKSISLVDEETDLAQESKHGPADNHHPVTHQTTPKAPDNPPKPTSTDSINSLNCDNEDEHGQDINSKTRQRKNPKTERQFKGQVHSRRGINAAHDLPDSYLTQGQLLLDNPSLSEDQERDSDSEDQERASESEDQERESESEDQGRDSETEDQERQGESSLLGQFQQQPSSDCSTCSFKTKKACRQDVSDIRGGCSQTEHTSLPNPSSSLYSQNEWSHGTQFSHRNLSRPGISKFQHKRKSGINKSKYPSKVQSDSPKTRHCSTDWPNSPASKHPVEDCFDASQSEFIYKGQGDASTTLKSGLDSQPGQWLFIATFFVFQIFLHWLYAR